MKDKSIIEHVSVKDIVTRSLCKGHECEESGAVCCRDCHKREYCEEVCGGEENKGLDAECEHRI